MSAWWYKQTSLSVTQNFTNEKRLCRRVPRNATIEDFQYVIHALKCRQIDVPSFITHRAHLSDVVNTFRMWTKPGSNVMKAMIEI